MSGSTMDSDFDHNFKPRERSASPSLRQRSTGHPMTTFAIIAATALTSMAFVPTQGPAFASFGAPVKLNEDVRTTARLASIAFNEAEIVCRGEAWGEETPDCLRVMATDSGRGDGRAVRRLASARPVHSTPNSY